MKKNLKCLGQIWQTNKLGFGVTVLCILPFFHPPWLLSWTGVFTKNVLHAEYCIKSFGLVAPTRIYRLFTKRKFDAYLLWPFGEKLIFFNSSTVYCSRLCGRYLEKSKWKINIVPHCEHSLKKVFLLDFVL